MAESIAATAEGTGLAIECGSFVRFSLELDGDLIRCPAFTSNGCGFALAAADALAGWLSDKRLADLHGLNDPDLDQLLDAELDTYPIGRRHCRSAAVEAMRAALANLRARRVEEFRGEVALVCSCFGVSEDVIAEVARNQGVTDVDEIGKILKAGTGCGSCRMIIREILDQRG